MVRVSTRKRLTQKKGQRRPSLKKVPKPKTRKNPDHSDPFTTARTDNESVSAWECNVSKVSDNDSPPESPVVSVSDHDYFRSESSASNVSDHNSDISWTEDETSAPIEDIPNESLEAKCLPQTVQDLLLDAKAKVELFLPPRWMVIVDQNNLHVVFYSIQKSIVIQRSLVFNSASGNIEVFVHNQPISIDEFVKYLDPPIPLEAEGVNASVDRIVNIVQTVHKLQTCSGYDDENFRVGWATCNLGDIDKNPFAECRYVETFRSLLCKRLVLNRKWRCTECQKLYFPLKRRAKAAEEEQRHVFTANKYLNEDQKLKKLQQQRTELDNVKKKYARLRDRMQEIIEAEGVPVDHAIADDLTEILSHAEVTPAQSIFLQQQIKASQQKNSSGMRWHPTMIRFALALHMTSPAAYEMVRQTGMIKLPCGSTLFDYSHVKPATEGIDKVVLESIASRTDKFHEKHKKYFVLMGDEIFIMKNLVFQKSTLKLVGYTTLDTVDSEVDALEKLIDSPDTELQPTEASKALVYMVKGVTNGIKEVVATFAVSKLTSNQMYVWTWEVIGALERCGARIIAFISDGSSVNRGFIKKHKPFTVHKSGIIFDTVNKAATNRVLYFIADVPHLLKTIRNCLLNSRWDGKKSRRKMMKNGKRLSWDFVIKLYEMKKSKSLRKSYKLNPMNVYPDSYARMKVNLAGQVMSATVGKDMSSQGWFDAVETVNFILKVNDWFDCLNGAHSSQASKTRNPNLAPYTSADDHRFDILNDFLKYLDDWETECTNQNDTVNITAAENSQIVDDPNCDTSEIEGGNFNPEEDAPSSRRILSRQTLDGIRMTTLAFKPMISFLLSEGASFINARIFCQDPLEQHFSKVRAGQGGSNNPNILQVLNRNRTLHTIGQLGMRKRKGNSGEEQNKVEVTTEPLPKRKSRRGPKFSKQIFLCTVIVFTVL